MIRPAVGIRIDRILSLLFASAVLPLSGLREIKFVLCRRPAARKHA